MLLGQQLLVQPLTWRTKSAESKNEASKAPSRCAVNPFTVSLAWGLRDFPQKSEAHPIPVHRIVGALKGNPIPSRALTRGPISETWGMIMFCEGVSLSSPDPKSSVSRDISIISRLVSLPPRMGMVT